MAIASEKTLTLLDPRTAARPAGATRAPRLANLRGQRVGLLANGKPNSQEFLTALGTLLRERHGAVPVALVGKPSASRVAPAETLDQLTGQCDAVVTAVGD
ncbi:MAG TPA: hypothetical protein VK066_19380 [Chloroflexota bacterium]|nr:hypothetical protein [Chloroflexota bacterium]